MYQSRLEGKAQDRRSFKVMYAPQSAEYQYCQCSCHFYFKFMMPPLLINLRLFLPHPSLCLSLSVAVLSSCRAAQQSRRSVHVPPAAPASPAAARLHLCPPGALRPSQPAEEDHAHAVPGQPGRGHRLEHGPGAASQQLGAQQQHPPGDQVNGHNRETGLLRLLGQQWGRRQTILGGLEPHLV